MHLDPMLPRIGLIAVTVLLSPLVVSVSRCLAIVDPLSRVGVGA